MFRFLSKFPKFLSHLPKYRYTPREIQLRDEATGYYIDPQEVTRRFTKLLALHDSVKNPSGIQLKSTWHELGIDDLSYVEIMLEAENEFFLEFPDEDVERFKNVNDVVEFVARSFYAK